jgi:hypothetical protein
MAKKKGGQCGGLFNTGKCSITREEAKEYGLRITAKRSVCNLTNYYGECNLTLDKMGLREKQAPKGKKGAG